MDKRPIIPIEDMEEQVQRVRSLSTGELAAIADSSSRQMEELKLQDGNSRASMQKRLEQVFETVKAVLLGG